jgi:hypothetical protein
MVPPVNIDFTEYAFFESMSGSVRVRIDKTQIEHIESGLPSKKDV